MEEHHIHMIRSVQKKQFVNYCLLSARIQIAKVSERHLLALPGHLKRILKDFGRSPKMS
jgi:hypothetical protein